MKKILPYSRQVIDEDDIRAVSEVLRSDWLTTGPAVCRFEEAFADKVGARFAVAYSNGTAALHGAYFSMGLGKGGEVIVPSNTFLATANAACYLGGAPRFADISPGNLCLDVDQLETLVGEETRGIAPVHFGGHPADMRAVKRVADRHGLFVVEDAAHALGAVGPDGPVGNCHNSDATIFSFHPVKHIATGEGGMVTTNDEAIFERLTMFRNHGTRRKLDQMEQNPGPWWYEMHELGYNYRLSDIHSALGLSQLKKLDTFVRRRRELMALYRELLPPEGPFLGFQEERPEVRSSYHLAIARIDFTAAGRGRAEMMQYLKDRGILTQVHYIPVNEHPYYRTHFPEQAATTPRAHEYYEQGLSVPLFPSMSDEDVAYVVGALKEAMVKS